MIATLVIFLREGVEASMIVAILLAYLNRIGHREHFRDVFLGVGAALILATAGGAVAYETIRSYDGSRVQTIFETATFLVAATVLTYMTFWMRKHARSLSKELRARADAALGGRARWGLGLLAFQAVGREGLETVVFTLAIILSTSTAGALSGAAIGLAGALVIAFVIYRLGHRLNLAKFFTVIGVLLMVFAAGLLADAVQNLQELGWLPVLDSPMWHSARFLSEDSALGDVMHSFFGYSDAPTVLQLLTYVGYLAIVIIAFLGLGTLFAVGLWPHKSMDFSNLTAHGGFFPLGVGAIFSSIVVVIFSMVGAEIATIAAAESKNPAKAVVRATNSVVARIGVFFVGSVFLLAVILPWNSTQLSASPYVSAFDAMGIPYAATIMNAVVLTAVLSCLNSGLYTASRMLFVLAGRREAPVRLISLSRRGVPMAAILTSTVVGFLCVLAAAISPGTVFLFLLNSSGAVILFVYLLIAVSQLVLRRKASPGQLKVKMWFYPWLTLLTIASILAVLVLMYLDGSTREQLLLSLLAWAVFIGLYLVTKWRGGSIDAPDELDSDHAEPGSSRAIRVLVLANETVGADELLGELRDIDHEGSAEYFLCVPATGGDPGEAELDGAGADPQRSAAVQSAQTRLDTSLDILHAEGLKAEGGLGDSHPMQAVEAAVAAFHPDRIVISTHPDIRSSWLDQDVIGQTRSAYDLPVRHIISTIPPTPVSAP